MIELQCNTIETSIGDVILVCDGVRLVAIDYGDHTERMHALLKRNLGEVRLVPRADTEGISSRMRDYFAGDVAAIDALAIAPIGTPFQQRAWTALRTIPPGMTVTYGAMAKQLGLSNSARAIGHANALNPIAIVVPCHRLVGASGKLTGYAGGLARKSWLLDHERAHADISRAASASATAGARL